MEIAGFEGKNFALQVIAKGSFIDNGVGYGCSFQVDVTTIRLNHVGLNEWLMSEMSNTRECYEDGPEGDAQWEAHKVEYAERRKTWEAQVIKSLDIDSSVGSVSITQAQTEIFTVVHILEIV